MSQWARENPERYAEIAALPLNQQNAALRDAIGYDPDRIRDELREHSAHRLGDTTSPRAPLSGAPCPPPVGSGARGGDSCPNCGAPADMRCEPFCIGEQRS